MNASDNRFYREPAIASSAERDLAEAIYTELTSEHCTAAAVQIWLHDLSALPVRDRLEHMLALLAGDAIDAVLARRESGHRYPPPPGENMGEPPP